MSKRLRSAWIEVDQKCLHCTYMEMLEAEYPPQNNT
ncbi:hypothetical protein BDI4_1080058 [Burkholderia diffusa]|nr:hypothetical protein BDI4_1080058 [Burkholderia diffusa]